jgi:hypothetical protein
MLQPDSSSFKEKLVNQRVIVKASLFTRAFSGTARPRMTPVSAWFSDEMTAALREVTGGAKANMDAPSIYLRSSVLEIRVAHLFAAQSRCRLSLRAASRYLDVGMIRLRARDGWRT